MIPLHDDNPTTITPAVTISLIGACVLVFFYQISLPSEAAVDDFIRSFGAIPAAIFGNMPASDVAAIPPVATLVSSMFLHGGLMHIGSNMLYLWIFGNNIEDVMGHARFIGFYFLCGIIAALCHAMIGPSSEVPMVGASGAISGALGAYILLYPKAQVLVLIPLGFLLHSVYVPAGLVLGLWFLLQLLQGGMSLGNEGGGVAFFAHIGGFIAGMALIPFFKYSHVPYFNAPRHRSWQID